MTIHVLGAVAAIGGGNAVAITSSFALRSAAPWLKVGGLAIGLVGVLCVVLLTSHVLLPDGVWERGAVYTVMAWQLAVGISIVGQRERSE